MTDEIFDDDGYPEEHFLKSIAEWDFRDGFDELLKHAMRGHTYPTCWRRHEPSDGSVIWEVSTGGWSGNESIIEALGENTLFWMVCWKQSRRGGHYIFECPELNKKPPAEQNETKT